MPIAVIVAALLSFFVAVGVRNLPYTAKRPTPTPTISVPSPTVTVAETPSIPLSTGMYPSATPKPSSTGSTAKTPTPTSKPIQYATSTPTPTTRTITSTPTPVSDTSAPTFDWMTGPPDGSTVTFNSFCFPMKYSDPSTPIMVRYAFDSDSLWDWNQNYAPCYQNVSNGSHSFSVQAKDAKGNVSGTIKRTFTVSVTSSTPTPTPATTLTPTATTSPSP